MVLAGLAPASMDLDLRQDRDMAVRPARAWDAAAAARVRNLVQEGVEGELRDYTVDGLGRHHGTLVILLDDSKEVNLNQLLVEEQFALYSKEKFVKDMAAEVDEEEVQVAQDVEGSCDSSVDSVSEEEVEEVEDLSRGLGGLLGKGRVGSMGKEREAHGKAGRKVAGEGEPALQGGAVGGRSADLMNRLKARARAREKQEEGTEAMWSTYREQARSRVDGASRASSNLLPGGVLVGKFHESVLVNLHAEGLEDQRRKFERFVAKK